MIDWAFVRQGVIRATIPALFAFSNIRAVSFYLFPSTDRLFVDARLYFRATEAWVSGGNPWSVGMFGVTFGAPPPALLLNLPFLPFGESFAVLSWIVLNTIAVVFLLRKFRLPWWWIGFYPISEGWLAGSADITLAALVFVGGSALAALAKPYSVPTIAADGRWRGLAVAAALALITVPILPWAAFIASLGTVSATFDRFGVDVSAAGVPWLAAVAALALVSLGWVRGLPLTLPALLALQPHYLVFALRDIAKSRILTAGATIPGLHAAALSVIAFAAKERVLGGRRR
jgi:hypothetical protein